MKKEYELLFGELIALARITDGNEHLITPESTEVIRLCLDQMASGTADTEKLRQLVIARKQEMVPDCFRCANPCGKTFSYDLGQLPEGELRDLKFAILEALCRFRQVPEALLYRALTVVSLWGYEKEDLLPILDAIR